MKMLTNMAIPSQDNAMLKLSWKFGESKWKPYWVILLTSSSGTNYIPHEHEGVDQYDSYAIPSQDNAMLQLSWKFGVSKWKPYWVILLTSYSGTNYILNEHEGVDQYGSFAIPSELMLYQGHPESLVNQNEILIELC